MYLGSPRMVEMVVSEKTTLEEMGGARLPCMFGSGHLLASTEADAIEAVRRGSPAAELGTRCWPLRKRSRSPTDLRALYRKASARRSTWLRFVRGLVDEDSLFEIHALWAREVVTGIARLAGQVIGVVATNPMFKGWCAVRRLRGQGGQVHPGM